ncbi:endonuclease domain-containing protein [Pseudorhizobium flavum]|uniref:Recombination endonuclease VII n=1 Tax=Pseudorhizobium flavum TaxID=1335061 RepID=A0A7W9Z3N3_9HYPH|nr:endonuclease domain-containing protein [Pseudorhizobium flavum]MBB6182581.1 hypothetical protein [Pseudorhizobium flavum]
MEKPLTEFSRGNGYHNGYRSHCKKCIAAEQTARLQTEHGREKRKGYYQKKLEARRLVIRREKEKNAPVLSSEQLQALQEEYGNCCGVCGAPNAKSGKTKHMQLLVDHNSRTGEIRGLLCSSCYSAMCAFGDDLEGIERVVSYLKRYECKSG